MVIDQKISRFALYGKLPKEGENRWGQDPWEIGEMPPISIRHEV